MISWLFKLHTCVLSCHTFKENCVRLKHVGIGLQWVLFCVAFLGRTKGSPSCLGIVTFILLSCSAQSSVLINPLIPLPVSTENQSVMRAAMLSRFRIGHTFSSLSPSSTSGERERWSSERPNLFAIISEWGALFLTALWKECALTVMW